MTEEIKRSYVIVPSGSTVTRDGESFKLDAMDDIILDELEGEGKTKEAEEYIQRRIAEIREDIRLGRPSAYDVAMKRLDEKLGQLGAWTVTKRGE